MSYSRRSRYSPSTLYKRYGRSISRSLSRSPSRDVENPGNNLYVTRFSSRIAKRELEKHFASEGKVIDVHLVVDLWTRESRGFGFVTMEAVKDAECCVKYLDRYVFGGRVIIVEKRHAIFDALVRSVKPTALWDLYAFVCGPSRFTNSSPKVRLLDEYFRLLGKHTYSATVNMIGSESFTLSNDL